MCFSETTVLCVACPICTQEDLAIHGDKVLQVSHKDRHDTTPVCLKEEGDIQS